MTDFKQGTKNYEIFNTNAPYSNSYQGNAPRWLFVCSAGLLRSPTGATMAAFHGINARSCGSNFNYALVPCSANLILWADLIIFVNQDNFDQLDLNYVGHYDLLKTIEQKAIVLSIEDEYEYMSPELQQLFNEQLFNK